MKYIFGLILVLVSCGPPQTTTEIKNCNVALDETIKKHIITCPDGSRTEISSNEDRLEGLPGKDGHNPAFRVEPASLNLCPNQGNIITMGIDYNDNTSLDYDEVTNTVVICNGENWKKNKKK